MIVVGVDPGARWTGVVARHRRELLHHAVVENPAEDRSVGAGYGGAVCRAIRDAVEVSGRGDVVSALQGPCEPSPHVMRPGRGDVVIAVEDVRAPSPHVRRADGRSLTNPGPIIETGVLLGWIMASFQLIEVVIVQPGGNGSQAAATYPRELFTDREWGNLSMLRRQLADAPQSSIMRHARSAWDVAGALMGTGRAMINVDRKRM